MYFKEAVSIRILELCNEYNYSPNRLAEQSRIAPSTLNDLINKNIENPSALVIHKICKKLNIETMDFFDSDLFRVNFDD